MTEILQQVKKLRKQQGRQSFIFVCMALGIFLLLGTLALSTQKEWDLSRGSRHSLTQTSVDLLQKVQEEGVHSIKFTAFMSKNPMLKEPLRDLVGQYQKHSKDITLEFIDPSIRPELVRELGITRDGEVILNIKNAAGNEQSELLRELSETSISNSILRLSRDTERFVLFLEGHAERNPFGLGNHDIQQFAKELDAKGFVIERFDLSQQASIPTNTRFIVIASPQLNYLPSEVEQLTQYLVNGGNLLWLSDPDGLKGLESLLTTLGIQSPKGTVIDQGTQELGIQGADASFSLISNYNQHPALRNFKYVSLFPQARTFELMQQDSVWKQTPFLLTAERTWLETEELKTSVSFNPEADKLGPLSIGYSLTREMEENESQQRIILIGDGDFLSNRFLNNGANLPLGLNLFDWLSGEEAFVNITFAETPDTSLNISERNLAWIGLFFLFILPGLCFIIAIRIWIKRRNA